MTPAPAPTRRAGPRARLGIRALLLDLRPYRFALLVAGALALVETAGSLGQPLLTRAVLNQLRAGRPIAGQVVALLAVLAVVAVVGALRDYSLQRTAERFVLATRRRLVARLLRLPIVEYDHRQTGDLLSRVGADTTLLRAVVSSGLVEFAAGLVMATGAAVALLIIDLPLFAVTAAGVGAGIAAVLGLARRVQQASKQLQVRVGEVTAATAQAIAAVRTIRASSAEEREAAMIDQTIRAANDEGLRIARLQALMNPVTALTIQVAFLLVLGIGGARVTSGSLDASDLVAFVLYLFMLWFPLGRTLNAYARMQSGLGALHRVEEVLDLPIEEADRPAVSCQARERQAAPDVHTPDAAPAMEFDRVHFAYRGGTVVLADVSFAVASGTRTALVGPSGAGKSTVLALLERFYDVTDGAVRVDGTDVRDLPRSVLRARLGYVEQGSPILSGTLRDNLALAAPTAGDEELVAALHRVNLGDVLSRTPLRLDAPLGDRGVLLSGGERQRLALARAFLAAPPILLLDEATSNLDTRNELAMREAIDAVSADRTLLVVAHRLSTVVGCEQIVVLERGRVVATGRHAELTRTNSLYRELASHQLLVR